METALFENRIVSVDGFLRARSSTADYPTCPVCREKLFLSATRSVKKAASFNHQPRDEDADRCPMSYSYHPSYSWLEDVDIEEIELRSQALKSSFYQIENLKRAFMFLSRVTGKGAISHDVFELLLQRADKFNIWRYSGLPLWAVPYILLTLTDFYIRREGKETYVVRLIIDKPSRSKLNTTWLRPGQCRLVKYFVNKGKATKVFGAQASSERQAPSSSIVGKVKNPLPFSEDEFASLTTDTAWITGGLEVFLRRMTFAVAGGSKTDSAMTSTVEATASWTAKFDGGSGQSGLAGVPGQAGESHSSPATEAPTKIVGTTSVGERRQSALANSVSAHAIDCGPRSTANAGTGQELAGEHPSATGAGTLSSAPYSSQEVASVAATVKPTELSSHNITPTSSLDDTTKPTPGALISKNLAPSRSSGIWAWVKSLLSD